MILVTGGARSGKSAHAERLASACGDRVLYIATSAVTDEEMARRVDQHRQRRPAGWLIHEGFVDLGAQVRALAGKCDAIMLECITTLITNFMFETFPWLPPEQMDFAAIEARIQAQLADLLAACAVCDTPVYLVTNEVGLGLVPETLLGRQFRDIAGRVNQQLATAADEVWLVISGIPVRIKG